MSRSVDAGWMRRKGAFAEDGGAGGQTGAQNGSVAALAALLLWPTAAAGQSAAPGTTVDLPPLVVESAAPPPQPRPRKAASRPSSGGGVQASQPASAPAQAGDAGAQAEGSPAAQATRILDAIAGSAAVVPAQDATTKAAESLAEMLAFVPGVVVQSFFGGNDQPRLQIRGSGLQQNPSERGTLVLQDGLPINRADGSYVVGLADPKSAAFAEVYRGYTANRLGATVLGGAINFVSPTGITDPGAEVAVEVGSFGQLAMSAEAGARQGSLDAHASLGYTERDGYREHNESERTNFNMNAGVRVNESISTRLFLGYTDLAFDVVGPLSRELLQEDPRQTCNGPTPGPDFCRGPNVGRDDPRRAAEQLRIGSRTTARYGASLFDVALGYTYTDDSFTFPISGGVRETEGGDFTAVLRYAYAPDPARALPLFELTGQYVVGGADRRYFINNQGEKGPLVGDNELDSSTLSVNAGFNIPLTERLTVSPALAYSHATRENKDVYTGATRPYLAFPLPQPSGQTPFEDTSYDHSYSAWTPSLALSYELARGQSVFAALSRSFEPPTHDDLIATINGSPNSSAGAPALPPQQMPPQPRDAFATPDLEAQTATTLEAGWKGRTSRLAWSATAYYSWVEDELLNLRDESAVSLGAVNADRTTHFGVELGAAFQITDDLSGRVAYTYQDFRFDGDPLYGDNRLGGAPSHIVNAALRYTVMPGLWVEAEVNWVPDETPVDNANNLYNDPFTLVDLRSSYAISDTFTVFGEVSNVFDEKYASATLIVDEVKFPDQAVFLPGDGRAFIAGIRAKF
ncbi:MAG: TonB-dependent receptor [Hyphomicrobiaceae bacterium]|nr:TonB-dependent receptor [Hyphomicrobiaceae bacterium]